MGEREKRKIFRYLFTSYTCKRDASTEKIKNEEERGQLAADKDDRQRIDNTAVFFATNNQTTMTTIAALRLASTLLILAMATSSSLAFSSACSTSEMFRRRGSGSYRVKNPLYMSTVLPRTDEKTTKKQRSGGNNEFLIPANENEIRSVEWLIDDKLISRDEDDPFHILLLDATFATNERITIDYVASSCAYVLRMPYDEAAELVAHAETEGFSCLGTWGHEECVRLGKELTNRDVVCRVVPYCEGGDRGWQARNAKDESGIKRAEEV